VNTPQSCQERIPTYQERPHLDPVWAWERNISIPNNNAPSGVQDSKPPRYSEGEGKRRQFEENSWETKLGTRIIDDRNVNKLKGVSVYNLGDAADARTNNIVPT
jgi:hypothetical protein